MTTEIHADVEKPLADTTTAANFLGVDPHTLKRWRNTGRVALPYIKFGGSVRYRVDDLYAFVEQNRIPA